jgi:hypothetical protein
MLELAIAHLVGCFSALVSAKPGKGSAVRRHSTAKILSLAATEKILISGHELLG